MANGREKPVQAIAVHREVGEFRGTFLIMSQWPCEMNNLAGYPSEEVLACLE